MTRFKLFCAALLATLFVATAAAETAAGYQAGTVTKNFNSAHKYYGLQGPDASFQVNNCGDFQSGQAVEYRVQDDKVYIRREGGKDYKCSIQSRTVASPAPFTYQKGTVLGWSTRVDTSTGSSGNGLTFNNKRRTRVYDLKGDTLVYQIEDCGSFQAGQFTAGQVVSYRVDESNKNDRRIYIQRESGKDYSCRMDGERAVENTPPAANVSAPAAPTTKP
jgi:hypothetical protein